MVGSYSTSSIRRSPSSQLIRCSATSAPATPTLMGAVRSCSKKAESILQTGRSFARLGITTSATSRMWRPQAWNCAASSPANWTCSWSTTASNSMKSTVTSTARPLESLRPSRSACAACAGEKIAEADMTCLSRAGARSRTPAGGLHVSPKARRRCCTCRMAPPCVGGSRLTIV